MPEGDGCEAWEYVAAKSMVAAFFEEKRGFLYKRELPSALDLVDHVIKSNVFLLSDRCESC